MRFRKSINICKGVKLNLSKTGASFTLGTGKGLSFNVGNKGAFVNWSIPGTGVYDRVRVDTLLKDKLGGLFGGKDREEETRAKKGTKAASRTPARKASSGPTEAELEQLAQERALIDVHQFAPDVSAKAAGTLDIEETEAAIEGWLSEAEAPIAFSVQTEVLPEKRAVMIDLDLPEIEDMPQNRLAELADGTLKIKKKTQKEAREDYKTCVFGLGEYVAGSVFSLAPGAQRVVVSAYTQRRDEKTGEQMDVFIYSVIFERSALKKGYQERDPYEFCGDMQSRFYVLASGVMKSIVPYEADEI